MIALITHKTQTLILSKLQKKIIEELSNSFLVFPSFPLWAIFSEKELSETTIEDLKNKIDTFEIEKVQIDNNEIFFPVSVKLKTKENISSKIVIATIRNTNTTKKINNTLSIINDLQNFPIKCRVIKIAKINMSENNKLKNWSIEDYCYLKIK